jgi:hypothetical protein
MTLGNEAVCVATQMPLPDVKAPLSHPPKGGEKARALYALPMSFLGACTHNAFASISGTIVPPSAW